MKEDELSELEVDGTELSFFGKSFRVWRNQQGISLKDLAQMLTKRGYPVDYATIGKYERGRNPPGEFLCEICRCNGQELSNGNRLCITKEHIFGFFVSSSADFNTKLGREYQRAGCNKREGCE